MNLQNFFESANNHNFNPGDPVIITGNVQFRGKTGDVREIGRNGDFIVVDLYNYGPQSFHVSDISFNDYADSDNEGVAEATGDKPFDSMMQTIKKGTARQATADRREARKQSQQRARDAFGPSPADKLGIRKPGVAEGSKMARHDKSAKAPNPKNQQEYDAIEKYRKDLAQSYKPKKEQGVAEGSPKDPNAPKKVQDRKTGKWYDPKKEFDKKMNSPEVMAQMKRMAQKEDVAESYPKHQDLSGISTEKLKAYLAKQGQQQSPGEGNQVKRVRAELQRRSQGVAEGAVKELSMDLETMNDQEFQRRYKMTKVQARANLKTQHENMSEMRGFRGVGGARSRENDENTKIDAMLAKQNQQLRDYELTGKFWLKQKDTQQHISDEFVGKAAANQAAIEMLGKRPELRGNLVITAYGPGEPVAENKTANNDQPWADSTQQLFAESRSAKRVAIREILSKKS